MSKRFEDKKVGELYTLISGVNYTEVECLDNSGVRSVCFTGIVRRSNNPHFPVGMHSTGWARDSFLWAGDSFLE